MDTVQQAAWQRIKSEIPISMANIDDHIMQLPSLLMEAAEHTARAIKARDLAEHELKVTASLVAEEIRLEKADKISEAKITSLIPLNGDYNQARELLEERRTDAALWQSLVDAIRTKQSALKMTTDLIISGYLTKTTIHTDTRAALAEQRRQERPNGVARTRPA